MSKEGLSVSVWEAERRVVELVDRCQVALPRVSARVGAGDVEGALAELEALSAEISALQAWIVAVLEGC